MPALLRERSFVCIFAFAAIAHCLFDVRLILAQQPPLIAETEPLSPQEQMKKFHLPPGFQIELVAAEPDIRKPMNLAFDARGRLWVTQTVEYPFPAKDEASARDQVRILEDTDGDGKADRFTTFADHLNIPIGIIPVPKGAVVYSIPNIYRFTDEDGDDRSDRRDLLLGPFDYKDTHGMESSFTWGFDGWIYATHGFANSSAVQGSDGHKIEMTSGNTFRFRMDGSRIERFTTGQVNPFGMSLDPLGNFYTADCHTRPVMQLLPGGWYPEFGRPHDGLGFAPEICDHDHESTAICGIVYYAADQFPPEYHGNLFSGNVVTNRVNRDRLEATGASYKAVHQPDFIKCDDPWFRPVNMQLGPDGAIYIADFYNRIIGHYEVELTHPGRDFERGRIWRVFYAGPESRPADRPKVVDLARASTDELISALAHSNLALRTQAANELVFRIGEPAQIPTLAILAKPSNEYQTVHALWVLERLGGLNDDALKRAAGHSDPQVRVHVQHILTERDSWTPRDRALVLTGLHDKDAWVQRSAAGALAKHPDVEFLKPLLDLRPSIPAADAHLVYAVRLAIRNQLRLPESWTEAEQLPPREEVDAILVDVVLGVHSDRAAQFLLRYVQNHTVDESRIKQFAKHIARYAAKEDQDRAFELLKTWCRTDVGRYPAFKSFIEGLNQRGEPPGAAVVEFGNELAGQLLESANEPHVLGGLDLVEVLKLSLQESRVTALAINVSGSGKMRELACNVLNTLDITKHIGTLARILGNADEMEDLRRHVAGILGSVRNEPAIEALVITLRTAPASLAVRIAVALSGSEAGSLRLLDEVAAGKTSAQLLTEPEVNNQLTSLKIPDVMTRVQSLTSGIPSAEEKIKTLIAQRKAGFKKEAADIQQGSHIFEKICAACHRIGNVGQKIAPELDGIGARGLDRLLEDTLDPSRNVDQTFRTTILELENGATLTGLLRETGGATLTLFDAEGKPISVPKDEVKEQRLSILSPMPSNIAEDLPEQDFYNLLAFLLSQRPMASMPANGKAD